MPNITNIENHGGRVWVFIDGDYCCSIRERTWKAMNLNVGSELSCYDLQEKERFFWKQVYGSDAWEKEKNRIKRVQQWFNKYLPNLQTEIVGFGADTTEFIKEHPKEKGKPDLKIMLQDTEEAIIELEVTGTEIKRGDDYWVRPDKIEYIQAHPNEDIWIVLHYQKPQEQFVWLKPILNKAYQYMKQTIRGADEYYVSFTNESPEIYTSQKFVKYIEQKISQLT